MTMRLPKQLAICGKTCDITYDPNQSGAGETDLNTGAITVGSKVQSEVLEILLHEAAEFILYSQGQRYSRYEEGNDGVLISMAHHGFENFIKEFTFVVEQIMGVKRIKSGRGK